MPPRMIKAGTILYHGTSCEPEKGMFDAFDPGHSDWDVVWLTYDETIAASFSMRSLYTCVPGIPAVLEVEVLKDMRVFDVDVRKDRLEVDVDDLSDAREIYQYVDRNDYGIVKMKGQVGDVVYDDYAVLAYEDLRIKRFKTFVDGEWSGWKDIEEGVECGY